MALDPTPRQWFLRTVAFLLGLFVLTLGAAFVFGGVSDSKAMFRSIAREADAPFETECAGGEDGRWRCWVYEPSGSGATRYLVRADGDCWSARRGRLRLEGCVALRDRYPFVDSAYNAWELQ
jgi:hypothetical protein